MKSVTGNPALDAYQRMAVTEVSAAKPPRSVDPAADPAPRSTAAAEVSISAEARERVSAAQQVDAQKVEALKAKIESGSLEIDSSVVARRMLDTLG